MIATPVARRYEWVSFEQGERECELHDSVDVAASEATGSCRELDQVDGWRCCQIAVAPTATSVNIINITTNRSSAGLGLECCAPTESVASPPLSAGEIAAIVIAAVLVLCVVGVAMCKGRGPSGGWTPRGSTVATDSSYGQTGEQP